MSKAHGHAMRYFSEVMTTWWTVKMERHVSHARGATEVIEEAKQKSLCVYFSFTQTLRLT